MALLNCSNCGESITDEDVICPHCGCPNYLSDEPAAAQVAVEKKPAKRGRPSTKETKEVSEEVEAEEKDEEEKIEIVEDDDEVKPVIDETEENDFDKEEPQVIEEDEDNLKDEEESKEIEESEEEPKEEEKKEFKPVEDINEVIGLTEKKTIEKEEPQVIEESKEDNEPQDTEEIDTEEEKEDTEEIDAEESNKDEEVAIEDAEEDDYDEPKHEDDVVLSIEEDKPEESEKEIEEEVPEVVDHKIADSYNDIIDESKYEESEEDKHRHIITAEGLLVEYNNKGEVIDKLIQEEKIGYEDAKKYVEMASEKLEQRLDALKRKSDKKLQETVNQEYISELKKYIDKMESDKQAVDAPTEVKEEDSAETNDKPVENVSEESALTVFIKNNPKVVLAIVLGLLFIALLLIIL